MTQIKHLFTPIKIGNIELPNRIVMLAMGSHFVQANKPDPRWRDFYAARAKGGAGLIIVPVNPLPTPSPDEVPAMYDDRAMEDFRELVEIVHGHGAKICAHFCCDLEVPTPDGGSEYVGPSDMPASRHEPAIRGVSVGEIRKMVEGYGEATRRSRKAGFDIVEYHFGVGMFLNRFISSATNFRTDEYGGSIENRLRFPLEIIASARQEAGEDFPLMCRISADELMPKGHTLKETAVVAPMLVEAGLAALNVQVGMHQSPVPTVDMSVPRGGYVHIAEAVKKMVDVPVVGTYRINDPVLADNIIAEGKADLVGMARAMLADPEFANKAKEGRFEDIRPCIACCACIDRVVAERTTVGCAVNPGVGHEAEGPLQKASKGKKVLVVGGGPGGMQAAFTAAERGHQVTLVDKGNKLGGQLLVAAIPPHKEELTGLVNYLAAQVKKSGVEVQLGREITPEEIVTAAPDAVIIATGAVPIIPNIPCDERINPVTAIDVLKGNVAVGEKVAIVGGGLVGCETALHLAKAGKQVTILEMLPRIGADIGPSNRWITLMHLVEAGVVMKPKSKVIGFTPSGVEFHCAETTELLEADTVILAVGLKPDDALSAHLQGMIPEVYSIGDCVQPRRLGEAIEEGLDVARKV